MGRRRLAHIGSPGDHAAGQPRLGREHRLLRDARRRAPDCISGQDLGSYNPRSIRACPAGEAPDKNTATWQFSTRPAVPEYWRCTPALALPFLTSPVSSTTNTAAALPRCSMTKPCRSSRTASASHQAAAGWPPGPEPPPTARLGLAGAACAGARLRPAGSVRTRPGPHRALVLQPGNLGGGQAELGEDLLVVLTGQRRRAPH